jgi:hypothetical protein
VIEALAAGDRGPLALGLRFVAMLVSARLRGDHARSPLFDRETGRPIAPPQVLSAAELRSVEAARDAR